MPGVTSLGTVQFHNCPLLESVTFGTAFEIETPIVFSYYAFGGGASMSPIVSTKIDLTLGKYVLPKPDLDAKTWQEDTVNSGILYT